MYSLSVHLNAGKKVSEEVDQPLSYIERTNIKLLNMLRSNGFAAYYLDQWQKKITKIEGKTDRIIHINDKPIWAVNDFDELPISIIQEISQYEWVTFTLQKNINNTPSH